MSTFIRNESYLRAVRRLCVSVGDEEYDADAVEFIGLDLDSRVKAGDHGFLARVAVVMEQEGNWPLRMDDYDGGCYWMSYEFEDLKTIGAWFVEAKQTGKWDVAQHYSSAVRGDATPNGLLGHPEVVQKAYIESLGDEAFDKFFDELGYELDCAVELGRSNVRGLSKLDELCEARKKAANKSENVPPYDVRYRKLIRDKGVIEHGAKMFGDVAYCEYVAKVAIIDRNWCEPYSDDWKFYDCIASVASRVLPLCL